MSTRTNSSSSSNNNVICAVEPTLLSPSVLKDSKIDIYSRMFVFMNSDKSNFVPSNAVGVNRVLKDNGKYAFLMESTSVEYVIERECELAQVGGLLDSKGYGIALPPSEIPNFATEQTPN